MVQHSGPMGMVVLGVLVCFSDLLLDRDFRQVAKPSAARGRANTRFLRAFRKASGLEAVMVASEQFRPSPLVSVFDFGYEEIARQVKARGKVTNRTALERTLQLGVSEELAKLERNMNWLATTASVSPVHRPVRHGDGHHPRVPGLWASTGSTSLRTVGPGIAEALIATAVGLFAAIPAAIFYNFFGHCHPRDRRAHGRFRAGVPEPGRAQLRRISHGVSPSTAAGADRAGAAAAAFRKSTSRRLWTWCWCC